MGYRRCDNSSCFNFSNFLKMMKCHIVIIISGIILYIFNNSVIFNNAYINLFMKCYFNDILCGILFPTYCNLLLIRKYLSINKLWMIELILLGCGLFWEVVAPLYVNYSVGDPIDIVAYLLGGIIYWIIYKRLSKTAM